MKITFFRSTLPSDGNRLYKSPMGSIDVPNSLNKNQAIIEAKKLFEEYNKIENWYELADSFEAN